MWSNGGEVLAAPIAFTYKTASRSGRLTKGTMTMLSTADDVVQFEGVLKDDFLTVECSGKMEYDGALIYALTVTPKRKVKVHELALEIPMKPDAAEYFLNGWAEHFKEEKNRIPTEPGKTLAAKFQNYFGVGAWDRGLQWFCESDEGWEPYDRADTIQFQRKADRVVLKMVIKENAVFRTPLHMDCGLMATPVRATMKPGTVPRIMTYWPGGPYFANDKYSMRFDLIPQFKKWGAEVLLVFTYWSDGFGNVEPLNPEELKRFVKACHEQDMRVIVYTAGLGNRDIPGFQYFGDKWLVNPITGFKSRPWERKDVTSVLRCVNDATYRDWTVGGFKKLIEDTDVDGIYYDWGCARCRNHDHGCGYSAKGAKASKVKVGEEEDIIQMSVQSAGGKYASYRRTAPVRAQREMWRRLYTMVHELKGDRGIIDAHCDNSGAGMYLGFIDTVLHSEDIACHLPEKTLPTMDQYRLFMTKQPLGLSGHMLAYERGGFPTHHEALALGMLFGEVPRPCSASVPTHLPNKRFAPVKAVWDAQDAFGVKDADAEWIPYWKNGPFVKDAPEKKVYVSLWRKPKSWLMVVSNLEWKPQTAAVRIVDRAMLSAKASDAMTGEAMSLNGDVLSVPLEGPRMRLIRLDAER